MAAIEIENLSFRYPKQQEAALENLSFSVEEGDFVVLCGPSGGGKTTLLRNLKPSLAPYGKLDGEIRIFGRSLSEYAGREEAELIGLVGQNPDAQTVCDKVWHELAFGMENLGIPSKEIRRRTAETAAFFGLEPLFYRDTDSLSGGQKQILALASVMSMNPRILLLDEPTAQLDPIAAENFLQAVLRLNRELGVTVLMTEHRLEEAVPAADFLGVLEQGRLVVMAEPVLAAEHLKRLGSPVFDGLPTPLRVYGAVENSLPCPLSVGQGRRWLKDLNRKFLPIPQKERLEAKTKPVLEGKDLWFRYEKEGADVLKGASLQLFSGTCTAILGGNGAGKTTLLSVLSGKRKPYRGKVKRTVNKIAVLPQDPKTLFSYPTVWEEVADGTTEAEKTERVLHLCGIEHLQERHPYDLSGGEQQRTALAKLLASEPEILLLDEPTKGLDQEAKKGLLEILGRLKEKNCTLLLVSHDVEFCAECADSCGLFFDGRVVCREAPRDFFRGNRFYTTAAARMAAGIIPNAITAEEVIFACGGKPENSDRRKVIRKTEEKRKERAEGKTEKMPEDKSEKNRSNEKSSAQAVCMEPKEPLKEEGRRNKKIPVLITVLLLMPLTLLVGLLVFRERKYYFISTLLIMEAIFPFLYRFEGRRPKAREIALLAALCGIGILSRAVFFMLPQFKASAAVVILAGICFGSETGFLVGAGTMFASNIFFGQGPWTPWQMAAMGLLGAVAGVLYYARQKAPGRTRLALFGFFAVLLLYGGVMNPASVLMFQNHPTREMFVLAYLQGLPFDVIHGAATFLFLYFAGLPVLEKMERMKTKYGLLN